MITLDTKCAKCGVTLRQQRFLALLINAGAKFIDLVKCPAGGDHQFDEVIEILKAHKAM